ncbi:MAG: hypothetical protein A2381_08800 [Bdellovibrionales bacterium RIFOXYB1_FULL_37_110]|nr:MAG: hypothetical protein A2181_08995 [Bdellovibrionales bacterium RIFOXYA1_FULL_38_20]OFZ51205.1 MAG: hypothetical protein A2417_17360 [Bdellovibrionales bacterium RIFOXYC1_FULL_37_79]OFZ60939.1 MAG: hypothetical protein A2381_08800 [Bdellovibrionales bacterium RIFOXYB1_FULL_37_110]OFZ63683.1 MAG: hypothetical protein A2577_07920 [Bdellovibrionales bacterium RIFOXYD1_FULL_36_51]
MRTLITILASLILSHGTFASDETTNKSGINCNEIYDHTILMAKSIGVLEQAIKNHSAYLDNLSDDRMDTEEEIEFINKMGEERSQFALLLQENLKDLHETTTFIKTYCLK